MEIKYLEMSNQEMKSNKKFGKIASLCLNANDFSNQRRFFIYYANNFSNQRRFLIYYANDFSYQRRFLIYYANDFSNLIKTILLITTLLIVVRMIKKYSNYDRKGENKYEDFKGSNINVISQSTRRLKDNLYKHG